MHANDNRAYRTLSERFATAGRLHAAKIVRARQVMVNPVSDATGEPTGRLLAIARLAGLTIIAASGLYARAALGPLQEAARQALNLTDTQMAMIQGPALALPLILFVIPIGIAIGRWSRRWILVSALLLALTATFASARAATFAMLFVARCGAGLAFVTITVTIYALIGDSFAPAERGRATMVVVIGQVAGSSVAFASGGFLLMAAGPSIEAWRDAMERMAWPFVPLILLAMAFNYPQRSGDGQDRDDTKPAPLRAIWRAVIDHRAIIAILIVGMTMVNVADGAALVWTAPLLARSYGVAAGAIGALLAGILLFSGLVGPVIGGVTADICHRHGGARRSFQMLGVFATLSVAAAFYPIAPGVTSASVLLCVLLTLGIAMGTMVTAVSVVLLPEHVRALCLSLQVAFGAIFGLGIAPLMVSGIGVVSGGALAVGPALGIVCAGTAMIGVTVFLIGQEAMGR